MFVEGVARQDLSRISEKVVVNSLKEYSSIEDLINDVNPRIIVVGTSENRKSCAFEIISKAKERGIKTVGVIDSPINVEERFKGVSKNPLAHAPDHIFVLDERTKDAYIKIGFIASKIQIINSPHADTINRIVKELESFDINHLKTKLLNTPYKENNIFLFASEMSDGLNSSDFLRSSEYTLKGTRSGSVKRTHIVLEEYLAAMDTYHPSAYKILRLHPKEDISEYQDYMSEFEQYSQGGSPYELIFISDMVCGLTSMLLYEAYLMGKKSLAILPREKEKDWLMSGDIPFVFKRDNLCEVIQNHKPQNNKVNEYSTRLGLGEQLIDLIRD